MHNDCRKGALRNWWFCANMQKSDLSGDIIVTRPSGQINTILHRKIMTAKAVHTKRTNKWQKLTKPPLNGFFFVAGRKALQDIYLYPPHVCFTTHGNKNRLSLLCQDESFPQAVAILHILLLSFDGVLV